MSSVRAYKLLIGITLALGAVLLLRPDWVLRLYSETISPAEIELPQQQLVATSTPVIEPVAKAEAFDVSKINFAVTSATESAQKSNAVPSIATAAQDPLKANHLTIPRMGVDADVIHGETDKTLLQGLWHIPGSAYPGENGNIVISAHRWLYKPPNPKTFYLIDKLQVGDPIYYDYQGSRYTYKVTKTFIVDPEDVQILKQDVNKLTLFTCTPLYSTKQRFVVNADLVSVTPL